MNPSDCYYYIAPANRAVNEPVIPLPEVGEGGPVYPGDGAANEPVIPLPEIGEGGPVYPGDGAADEPVVPLPGPGEGGPVYPGGGSWPGGIIVQPTHRPRVSRVRFLNAAYGYPALRIWVANSQFASRLNYASVTNFGRVPSGYQIVKVADVNGRVYIQRSMPFQANGLTTVAVVRTSRGLDLLQIADECCPPGGGYSSFRMVNLAYNSGPMDVLMSDGRVVYSDLRYKEAAAFRRIMPGTYQFFYADTGLAAMPAALDIETLDSAWLGVYPPYETFGSLYLEVSGGEIYTVYLLQSGTGRNKIQNLILVDR